MEEKPFDVRAKLATELGRIPPEQPKEDYAPQRVRQSGDEYRVAQEIKQAMRSHRLWDGLKSGEREALELIATEISRICAGRNFWKDIMQWATLGQEEADRD